MSKRQWIMLYGVAFAALPFLGFPSSWDTVFAIALGLLTIATAYFLPAGKRLAKDGDLPFTEHRNDLMSRATDAEPSITDGSNPPAPNSRLGGTITNDSSPN